jgi:hypothetical protein
MRLVHVTAILAALFAAGCTGLVRAIPPSREPCTEERLANENARLQRRYDTEHELNMRLAYELETTRIEIERLRAALAASTTDAEDAPPVAAFEDFEVRKVRFGLLTGPSDWDDKPGPDGIKVFILPEDSEGTTLKRKGSVLFELLDIANREQKVVMSWPVPAETLAANWWSLPPGFRMELPWRGQVPWGHEVLFRATFTDARGIVHQTSTVFVLEKKVPETPAVESTQ